MNVSTMFFICDFEEANSVSETILTWARLWVRENTHQTIEMKQYKWIQQVIKQMEEQNNW